MPAPDPRPRPTVPPRIAQCDPRAGYVERQREIDAAMLAVLESGQYCRGPRAEAMEREFAAFVGAQRAVAVASGTDALVLALKALGIGRGDCVVTASHTAVATVAAIDQCGAEPVLLDVDAHATLCPDRLRAALARDAERRIRAVVPVHLYGQMADMPRILDCARAHGAAVVEDCAQAHGARLNGIAAGRWGDMAAFSFYPTKNLGALGDGGAIVTDDDGLADAARRLAQYGWVDRVSTLRHGQNSRLDEIQAAVLRVKLGHLEGDNRRRAAIAARYDEVVPEVGPVARLPRRQGCAHVYHQYVVVARDRDALRRHLDARGIDTAIHYPRPVHDQPAYAGVETDPDGLERTAALAETILSLPMYPQLPDAEVSRVCAAIADFLRA